VLRLWVGWCARGVRILVCVLDFYFVLVVELYVVFDYVVHVVDFVAYHQCVFDFYVEGEVVVLVWVDIVGL